MKELYERAELEVVIFQNEDIITTSPLQREEDETERVPGQS